MAPDMRKALRYIFSLHGSCNLFPLALITSLDGFNNGENVWVSKISVHTAYNFSLVNVINISFPAVLGCYAIRDAICSGYKAK